MSADINTEMQIMQENLCDLRKIAGWTAEALANKMGVTKQTVSNIETQKVKISRIQYIAIRAIFECEVVLSPSKTTLKKVLGKVLTKGERCGIMIESPEEGDSEAKANGP